MHATVRRYEGVLESAEELDQAFRGAAWLLSDTPGFVSFLVLEGGPNVLLTVGIFEDRECLESALALEETDPSWPLAARLPADTQATTGEIVFQKGL